MIKQLDNNTTRMIGLIREYGMSAALHVLEDRGVGKMERTLMLVHAMRLMGWFNNSGKNTEK